MTTKTGIMLLQAAGKQMYTGISQKNVCVSFILVQIGGLNEEAVPHTLQKT